MMRLEEGLVTLIDAQSPSLATPYYGTMPAGVTYPAITYNRISTEQRDLLDRPDTLTSVVIQIDVWGDSPATVTADADALLLLLDGYQGAMGEVDVQYVEFLSENDTHEFDGDFVKHRVSMDFRFTLHETVGGDLVQFVYSTGAENTQFVFSGGAADLEFKWPY